MTYALRFYRQVSIHTSSLLILPTGKCIDLVRKNGTEGASGGSQLSQKQTKKMIYSHQPA